MRFSRIRVGKRISDMASRYETIRLAQVALHPIPVLRPNLDRAVTRHGTEYVGWSALLHLLNSDSANPAFVCSGGLIK